MGHWHVLLLWDLATHRVDGSGWDGESAGGWGAGTGEISLGVLSKVLDDGLWAAVGEKETDVAGKVRGELVDVLLVGGLWGSTERLSHDLCLSEEKAFHHVSVCFSYIVLLARAALRRQCLPRVGQLRADLLEVGVAHVLDGKDETVLILIDGLLNIGEKLEGSLLALLVHLSEVHDLLASGNWHFGCGWGLRSLVWEGYLCVVYFSWLWPR